MSSSELAVVVPTRSRPHLMPRMVRAFQETGAFDVADLYIGIDRDDMAFDQYRRVLDDLGMDYAVMQEWQPLVPKLNRMATSISGDYQAVAFMGDDHVPRTNKWAHLLLAAHSVGQARILYGQDGFQDRRLPTWWSMDSRIIEKIGRMVPSQVQHLYCDNAVKILGERTGRLVYLEQVLIEHMHPVAGKAASDPQYIRVNRKQQYARDQLAFSAWVEHGLYHDVMLLESVDDIPIGG